MDYSENRRGDSSGNAIGIKLKLRISTAALLVLLIVCVSTHCLLRTNPGTVLNVDVNDPYHDHRQLRKKRRKRKHNKSNSDDPQQHNDPLALSDFTICGRALGSTPNGLTPELRNEYSTCPDFDPQKQILIIEEGQPTYGRTGNHLRSIAHAIRYTRDHNIQLGIVYNSWAMKTLTSMWFVHGEDVEDWIHQMEITLCVKVFRSSDDWHGWQRMKPPTWLATSLFRYHSFAPQEEYTGTHLWLHQTLFQHYNTGDGIDQYGNVVPDMCSGIKSVFGNEEELISSATYSVIHMRQLEDKGREFLALVSKETGCDPEAGLKMEPNYIRSILAPLGMLDRPIVIITDDQDRKALGGLLKDVDIGPMLHVVREEDIWFGGDVTLAVMATVFIGNPASTMSKFIAQSRVALGFGGQNYMYRARNAYGEWTEVCGNECLFRRGTGEIVFTEGWPSRGYSTDTQNVQFRGYTREYRGVEASEVNTGYQLQHYPDSDANAGIMQVDTGEVHPGGMYTIPHPNSNTDVGIKRKVYTGLHPDDMKNMILRRQVTKHR